ncbi:MAG: N-acetyltransferase [Atopostipes sp.]|nr:N-acetyltransferase [Atopostipes sp.]
MKIKLASKKNLPQMRKIFNYGRKIQLESGNLNQWQEGYPSDALILEDIQKRAAHLSLNDNGEILAIFSLFTEADPTYTKINGNWLNNEKYATIHRIASSGIVSAAGQDCIKWVLKQYDNVRIDTHHKNEQMKHVLEKLGFHYCGIIYLENGEERNAYQYSSGI